MIDRIEIRVEPGEVTIVSVPTAPIGTLLAATAAGLRPAGAGEVRLDGMPLADADSAEVRRALRLVGEDPMLMAGTVRDNVAVGAGDDVEDRVVVEALEAVGAGELADPPDGLDADVGPDGALLSEAQRQRVALARAVIGGARVLILDDALSALSTEDETAAIESVRRAYGSGVLVLTSRRPPEIAGASPASLRTAAAGPPETAGLTNAAGPDEIAGLGDDRATTGAAPGDVETAAESGPPMRTGASTVWARWGQATALSLLQIAPALVLARVVALVASGHRGPMGRWAAVLVILAVLYSLGMASVAFSRRRMAAHPAEPSRAPRPSAVLPILVMSGVAALAAICVVSPSATVAPVVLVLIGVVDASLVRGAARRATRWSGHEQERVASLLLDHLRGRPVIRQLGAERVCTSRYVWATWDWRRSRWWLALVTTLPAALVQGTALVLPGAVLALQYQRVLDGHEAVPTALCLGALSFVFAVQVVSAVVQPTAAGDCPPPVLGQPTQV